MDGRGFVRMLLVRGPNASKHNEETKLSDAPAKAKAYSAWMKGQLFNLLRASKNSDCQKHSYF